MGSRGPAKGQIPHAITKARIDLFLRVFRESGANFTAAAAAACPGEHETAKPCLSSFQKLRKTNIEFAAACEEIHAQVCDDIEAEIDRRGRIGWLDPVVQKGEHVIGRDGEPMFIRRFDSKLLLARAKSLMPTKYGDSKKIEITHRKGIGAWEITSDDLKALDSEQKRQLADLISVVQAARAGIKAIEHQPRETLDVPVIEVEPVAVEVVTGEAETFPAWED